VNHPPEESKDCDAMSEDLMEFALGTLSGRPRSLVLEHLESCSLCRAELESLASVADTMLWLAPQAEPPLGFETRLMERFKESDARLTAGRRERISVLAIAALLIAVLAFGVGAIVKTPNANITTATSRPTTGQLLSNGHVLGEVSIAAGSPSWMIMNVDYGKWSGVVWCEVTLANGHTETIGKFTLSRGSGSWVAPIRNTGSPVRSAQLVDAKGAVLASATLTV
jgi:Putative zinc-finger